MEIKKLDANRFIVEKTLPGMNTNVVIYTNESMLEKMKKDRTLQQAVNAASLPHPVGNVLLMPDSHEGYGFPIGGVMAFDSNNGIISPGAVGFDINCLHPETRITDEYGAWHRIDELKEEITKIITYDTKMQSTIKTTPFLFLEKDTYKKIIQIKTKYGNRIMVTGDHPILTKRGMILAKNLYKNDLIVTDGFSGVRYVKALKKQILSKDMLIEVFDLFGVNDSGNAKTQILTLLDRLGLCEIDSHNKKLPIIIKLMGLAFGDGTCPNIKKGTKRTVFYGKKEDLLEVKKDVESLGFKCLIQHRKRFHKITTRYKSYEFEYDGYSATISSTGFTAILVALGVPFGNKTVKPYRVPEWILNAEDWQKRLFLAAYFGAELSTPCTHNDHKFIEPAFRFSKIVGLTDNAVRFLLDIKDMLNSFGIETSDPTFAEDYRYITNKGEAISFRLRILSNGNNIQKLFSSIGYVYNREKERRARLVASYLLYLESVRIEKDNIKNKVIKMHSEGIQTKMIVLELATKDTGRSFIEHTIWGRDGRSIAHGCLKFSEFVKNFELGRSGLVYDTITNIEELDYIGKVYDLTVDNENHNFVADSIVVSNCGVKLIKTNLEEDEVRSKIMQLSDALFKNIPSGVGSKMQLGLTQKDLEKIAEEGASYIINKGFGFKEDVERIEENGVMVDSDFSKVSSEAKSRGLHELGTLGAGNHFLEVQKVEKIFDANRAKSYGLHEGQIVIMVHTGSRGFGHQICSDYLRTLAEYHRDNNITLVDKELSYAKVGSKEADNYLGAMKCAVNFAFTNRQIITNSIRKSFEETFGKNADALGMDILYDLSHNIVKLEEHEVDGKRRAVYVHRKGATRAFPKGMDDVPKKYRAVGQPVLIPGSMGTASYVLCGSEGSMKETFGSSCHGAGRVMSRHQAIREIPAEKTFESLRKKNIEIRIRTRKLVSEEAEWTYKDIDEIIKVVKDTDLAIPVSRNVPIAVVKG
jgi:tRNA-splicing ligase RtcB (3'-phosphate/5'-hydroxy nucleic acid ligase)